MNKLPKTKRIGVIQALVEGCSIRFTVRMTGVSKKAVLKLLVDIGQACRDLHYERVRRLRTARVQCDEQWAFVVAKAHVDAWLWVGIDADTKLVISWAVGQRDETTAYDFTHDLAGRLINRVQLTTEGLNAYLGPIMDAFGPEVDYGQLVKLYGDDPRLKNKPAEARYSSGQCVGAKPYARLGLPDVKRVSTPFVERQNLTTRMSCRRFTRLTDALSRKIESHEAAISLHYAYYNWCRVHETLRVTPAMEAGLTDHVWTLEELVSILEQDEAAKIEAGAMKRGRYRPKDSK